LLDAYKEESIDQMSILLRDYSANPNIKDETGVPIVIGAILQGNAGMASLLCRYNAAVETEYSSEQDIFCKAAEIGSLDVFDVLLRNKWRQSPAFFKSDKAIYLLCAAARANRFDNVFRLLEYGVDVNAQNPDNKMTVAHYVGVKGDHYLINCLEECGADLTLKDYWGYTPRCRLFDRLFEGFTNSCALK